MVCLKQSLSGCYSLPLGNDTFYICEADVDSCRQDFNRFGKGRMFDFHHEFDGVTRFLTAKAMVEAFAWCYVEGRRAFVVKLAYPFIRSVSRSADSNVLFHLGCA